MAAKVESSKARAAYEFYLSLGPQRSVEKVRQTYPESTPTFDMLKRWCTDWNWVERARAYDAEQFVRERAEREIAEAADRQRRHERRLADLDAIRPVAEEALKLLAEQAIRLLADPKDVLKFFEVLHKQERLEMGEATEKRDMAIRGHVQVDLTVVPDADLDAFISGGPLPDIITLLPEPGGSGPLALTSAGREGEETQSA